jgi:hypothetical protein
MVAIEVFGRVLQFSINSLMQIFEEANSGRFSLLEMGVNVLDEDREALCSKAKLLRSCVLVPDLLEHDPGVAGSHLRSANRISAAVMLNESERLAEPYEGFLQIPIDYVRKHRVSWYRAIGDHRLFPPREKLRRQNTIPTSDNYTSEFEAACVVEMRQSAAMGTWLLRRLESGL